jgi:hypothetical protein
MSNRETYPASQSPLAGDISGKAGQTLVTVVGIQTIPVSPTPPSDQQGLIFRGDEDEYVPTQIFALAIEGRGVSMDKQIYINGVPDGALIWGIEIEGVPDGG